MLFGLVVSMIQKSRDLITSLFCHVYGRMIGTKAQEQDHERTLFVVLMIFLIYDDLWCSSQHFCLLLCASVMAPVA